uniref:Uncharacterized protein n=1 Tax=Glossina austeni TaxID=7395 RepID=A0A1A9V9D8_GLOAU
MISSFVVINITIALCCAVELSYKVFGVWCLVFGVLMQCSQPTTTAYFFSRSMQSYGFCMTSTWKTRLYQMQITNTAVIMSVQFIKYMRLLTLKPTGKCKPLQIVRVFQAVAKKKLELSAPTSHRTLVNVASSSPAMLFRFKEEREKLLDPKCIKRCFNSVKPSIGKLANATKAELSQFTKSLVGFDNALHTPHYMPGDINTATTTTSTTTTTTTTATATTSATTTTTTTATTTITTQQLLQSRQKIYSRVNSTYLSILNSAHRNQNDKHNKHRTAQ